MSTVRYGYLAAGFDVSVVDLGALDEADRSVQRRQQGPLRLLRNGSQAVNLLQVNRLLLRAILDRIHNRVAKPIPIPRALIIIVETGQDVLIVRTCRLVGLDRRIDQLLFKLSQDK